MANSVKFDFGSEMAGILPLLLREVVRKQDMIKLGKELSHDHVAIIDLLTEKGSSRMSRIAAALNLTMGAVTGIIDKMVANGLVKRERPGSDRRVVKVTLLKKGQEAARRINKMRRELTNELYASLSEKEKRTYVTLLKKVYTDIGQRQ
ncbi:MAG: MarR family transcriptional regulator [Candidatus Omnitrophica bacterium]|nr:MarR family transcriptional regulator [Candidatus Omnitrophota bacterium]MBU1128671.1 MarR family transcriptional regulator [Candidatus Omnitrophota bacterium]MBU1656994.1 MarR family transcriptional regulator [Candidatus Omnitrophota bacterium]MBU1785173.1 MarR family transcriptional regulator [Candidatus Omnitrophota bacterium]MBU1852199.1 MarR family transcriptional regulator [Candidatus Omnitrophota bacterium]